MSNTPEVGRAVGEHWLLLVGVVTAVAAILGALKVGRSLIRSEINEGILLSLENGAGKRVEQIVRTAVHSALDDHRDRIDSRILELERMVLEIMSKTKN